MLIACTSCGSKIRVPDGMAGKKGKCPKCALVFTIPEADAPPGLMPLEIPAAPAAPAPAELGITAVPPAGERVTTTPAAPPPAAEEPAPVSRRPAWEDDEDDRERRRSRRRDRDEDDDDYGDVRRRLRRAPDSNGLALSAMIIGIVSASLGVLGFCCWIVFAPLAGIGGTVAVILGFLGKSRGDQTHAITGIVLGFIAIGLSLLWIFCGLFGFGLNILAGGFR